MYYYENGFLQNTIRQHGNVGYPILMFTTTLLNEDCRRKPHLWKCLGFLPSPNKKKNDNGRHVRYYHAALDAMLVSIEKAQKDPPLIRVRLGNEFRYCNPKKQAS